MKQEQEIKDYNQLMMLINVIMLRTYREDIHVQVDLNNEDRFEELYEVQTRNLRYTNHLKQKKEFFERRNFVFHLF